MKRTKQISIYGPGGFDLIPEAEALVVAVVKALRPVAIKAHKQGFSPSQTWDLVFRGALETKLGPERKKR